MLPTVKRRLSLPWENKLIYGYGSRAESLSLMPIGDFLCRRLKSSCTWRKKPSKSDQTVGKESNLTQTRKRRKECSKTGRKEENIRALFREERLMAGSVRKKTKIYFTIGGKYCIIDKQPKPRRDGGARLNAHDSKSCKPP